LIVSPLKIESSQEEYPIESIQSKVNFPLNISFSVVDEMESTSNSTIFVDYEKLEFPLVLRHWKEGDVFQPFGMEGKSKKVSKLFKDEKLSVVEKEATWLLCSANQVVWVVGMRQDERYKINSETKKILKIAIEL
jgi:tRNA(Ile)-lysidine synthase